MMRAITAAVLLGCLAAPPVAILGTRASAGEAKTSSDLTPEEVRKAIDSAVAYVKSQQKLNGSWSPDYPGHPGGISALCTLALLSAGVEPSDDNVKRALDHLRKLKPQTTYAVALQTMVFCRAEPKADLLAIGNNVRWLERTQVLEGPRKGAWSYPGPRGTGGGDNSNSQFAMLALHEAERAGVQVRDDRTWRLAKAYWEDCQNPDGSWGYFKGVEGAGSMTCAGITSLIITGDKVHEPDAKVTEDGRILCCQKGEANDDRIQRGLQWLGGNFSVARNPGGPGGNWLLYYLYGVERVGRLTAHRFFYTADGKPRDWYREAAAYLIREKQDALSGYFTGTGHVEKDPLIGTSLALLFLAKGRRPVLVAKLSHGPADDWNQHRSDVANLTGFVEKRWGFDLSWEVIDLRTSSVDDLLQSPVLYLCGSVSPLPANAEAQQQIARKLRDYLDRGGFLFADAYCRNAGFDQAFRELMKLVFPEPEYQLRLLEPEHPVWYAEEKVAPEQLRPLLGVEFGCRTSVIYAPPDPPQQPRPALSCLWELARAGRGKKYPQSVQAQIDGALALGLNIMAYATNRELKFKYEIPRSVAGTKPGDQVQRGKLYIAKLRHPGGCNAAPRALVNLLETANTQLRIRATARDELLDLSDPTLFDYHLVFMHGRNNFRFTDAERKQLRTFVERGGMVLADSICASRAFTDSFRREMALIFPERKLERVAANDPLWTTKYGGFELKSVTRRDPQRSDDGSLRDVLRKVPPELEGIRFDDRWGVIFSQYDLSCALEKRNSLECRGYAREDAARIGLNVLLYSLQQ